MDTDKYKLVGAFVTLSAAAPFVAMLGAAWRAAILFWPTMILLGAVHTHVDWVPALGWQPTALVVALISLLVPLGGGSRS